MLKRVIAYSWESEQWNEAERRTERKQQEQRIAFSMRDQIFPTCASFELKLRALLDCTNSFDNDLAIVMKFDKQITAVLNDETHLQFNIKLCPERVRLVFASGHSNHKISCMA